MESNPDGADAPGGSGSGSSPSNANSSSSVVPRSKPCREIYRPPNLRKGGPRHDEYSAKSSHTRHGSSKGHGHGSRGQDKPKFNINAKEFCYQPKNSRAAPLACQAQLQYDSTNTFQTIEQQLKAYRAEDYMSRNSGAQAPAPAMAAAAGIVQSKSVGNVGQLLQLQGSEACHFPQVVTAPVVAKPIPEVPALGPVQERRPGILTSTFLKNNARDESMDVCYDGHGVPAGIGRLAQSKSSGNVPAGQHKVRFRDDDEEDDDEDTDLIGTSLSSLKLKSEQKCVPSLNNFAQLQKSRTMASYAPWSESGVNESLIKQLPGLAAMASNYFAPQANPWLHYIRLQQQQLQHSRGFPAPPQANVQPTPTVVGQFFTANVAVSQSHPNHSHMVKRSKSFHAPSAAAAMSSRPRFQPLCPSILDFQITKWPKSVQEAITTVVTGAERNVTARHKIEMVAQIFEVLFNPKSTLTNERELILPAVNVFVYFLIKEQHNLTIAECLVNSCYETFQVVLAKCKEFNSDSQHLISIWITFLKFLSAMYSQIKVIRLQQLPGQSTRIIGDTSSKILSLTCDVCLATLSSHALLLITPETTDHLFMIMTSIGRDMEAAYPTKMKQVLTAVRDVLLGVADQNTQMQMQQMHVKSQSLTSNRLSPCIQKTLMQLIELHAANWNLPASAVRYYYNSNDTK